MAVVVFLILLWVYFSFIRQKKSEDKSISIPVERERAGVDHTLDPFRRPEYNGFARVDISSHHAYQYPLNSFVAIDVETASPQPFSICSISAVKVENGQVVDKITSFIRPPEKQFTNSHIHHITWDTVKEAPTFEEYYKSTLCDFIGGYVLVAHNAPFDIGCLKHCDQVYSLNLHEPILYIDTVEVARSAFPGLNNYKLSTVCAALGLKLDHHNSLSDAEGCTQILLRAIERGIVPNIYNADWADDVESFRKTVIYLANQYKNGISFNMLFNSAPLTNYKETDFIKEFVDTGILKDATKEVMLSKMKKAELQKILDDAGIEAHGLKKDLTQEIIDHHIVVLGSNTDRVYIPA